ncbi:MAG: class I SAM-dependent methyltransferase [Rhodovibrionaceae bacterium]|nr:class I SAM-dependent methyltransferase [Rhodovibrionaceae bacterium]
MSDAVRDQYEAYPYPARDPREERKRLVTGSPSNLAELNHYLFAGTRDFAAPFRALVAGGGTGDGTIMLAQQLANAGRGGEVVYLDISEAARKTAEARAQARGLANIAFHTGSLLDLPQMDLGRFDYIDCCGVLHHLAKPAAGFRALTEVLAPGGGMGLMVYAPYGRAGVYQMQEMLRLMGEGLPLAERIPLARRLLDALPASNWLKRNPVVGDHKRSDAELVDLFLHPQDRAFTVSELLDVVEGEGFAVTGFIEPARYRPETYLSDPALLRIAAALPQAARWQLAEDLACNIKKHIVYVTHRDRASQAVASTDDAGSVPVTRGAEAEKLAQAIARDRAIQTDFGALPVRFPLPRLAPAIIGRIDGLRSIGAIADDLATAGGHDPQKTLEQARETLDALISVNLVALRKPSD